MLNPSDLNQLQQKGISPVEIDNQIKNFIRGFPYVSLVKACTPQSGLKVFDKTYAKNFAEYYSKNLLFNSVIKFVPASGAASRMFSHLFSWCEENRNSEVQQITSDNYDFNSAEYFLKNIRKFAFFDNLKLKLHDAGYDIEELLNKHNYALIIEFLLNERGLNYAKLPKALIKFHKYAGLSRTALDEHLAETAQYCKNENNEVHIHFTISPEHIEKFETHLKSVLPYFEKKFNAKYNITHSVQKPSTDTIAVDENNEPFRNNDGSLLFRPGGHGALIHNLNEINTDIVFVKNIDNLAPESLSEDTVFYKKVLAGYLLYIRFHVYEYLRLLENESIEDDAVAKITSFIISEFAHDFPLEFNTFKQIEKANYLKSFLNRPLRICGMVKNQGEPGGGPFFVCDSHGHISQQIVESSQVNMNDETQKNIFKTSTHFNPVDLVCSFVDYKGKKFNLLDFVDPGTGFISTKSKDGRPLKAQELPGLWNGAMAYWNTIFVEVPITTFNPVKTVNDLLRKEHLE